MTGLNAATVRGDAYAEAAGGDCSSLGAAMNRATGMGSAVILAPGDFDGDARVYELGSLRACHVKCSPMKVDGREVLDSDWPRSGAVHVIVQVAGRMTVNRLGRSRIDLQPADWCVVSRVGRFWAEADTPVEFVLLVIPGEELASIVDALARLSERTLRASSGAARLFVQFVLNVMAQAPTLAASSRISVSDALIQVMKTAILELGSSTRSTMAQEELYRRACEIIEAHIGDGNLSIDFVAQKIRCSKRYLHFLFSRHGENHTITSYIRSRRLSRCRLEFLMKQGAGVSIAEIAHRWGFDDPSYFARLFRREYGVSPKAFITQAMQAENGFDLGVI